MILDYRVGWCFSQAGTTLIIIFCENWIPYLIAMWLPKGVIIMPEAIHICSCFPIQLDAQAKNNRHHAGSSHIYSMSIFTLYPPPPQLWRGKTRFSLWAASRMARWLALWGDGKVCWERLNDPPFPESARPKSPEQGHIFLKCNLASFPPLGLSL
jgi:hypothetical protein